MIIKIFATQSIIKEKTKKENEIMLEKLAELIKEQLNYDGEVKAESNFKDDLGADSLDLFSFACFCFFLSSY